MVKNTKGGGHARKLASKGGEGSRVHALRLSTDPSEVYAVATRMTGNGRFFCKDLNEIERACHISGRFSGRNKRHNWVRPGSWVLVGLRDFGTIRTGESSRGVKCDLLEVYDEREKTRLRDAVDVMWSVLDRNDPSCMDGTAEVEARGEIVFASEEDCVREELRVELETTTELLGATGLRSSAAAADPLVVFFDDI
jgi:translation initiation factor IF-1